MASDEVHSAGLILRTVNEDGRDRYLVLLARWGSTWSFPKGMKNKAETDLQCALRETFEETGLSQDEIQLESREPRTISYHIKPTKRIPNGVKVVRLFYAYLKNRREIQLSKEHISFRWLSRRRASQLLRPELASVLG